VATTQNAYVKLRRFLVEDSLVAVVSLPAGVFKPYSGVKTSILLLDKKLARTAKEILFLKITADGFDLGDKRNPIEANDLPEAERVVKAWLKGKLDSSFETHLVWQPVEKSAVLGNKDVTLVAERFLGIVENNSEHHPMVRLGDEEVFKLESGATPSTDKPEYWGGPHAWATLVDLPAEDLVTNLTKTARTITDAGLKNSSAVMLSPGSILVSTRATLGRIAVARIPVATNQGFKNIVIKDASRALPEYVALAVTRLRPQMLEFASGGTFKEISKANFALLEIPLPPLEEQQGIVAEIEGYQKVIDGARQILAGYRFQLDVAPDWESQPLGEICQFIDYRGRTPEKSASGVPLITAKNIRFGFISCEPAEFVTEETYREFMTRGFPKRGDVLFTTEAPMGMAALIDHDNRFALAQRSICLSPNPQILSGGYLCRALLCEQVQKSLEAHATGSTVLGIKASSLKEIEIPIPPLEEQRRIVAELDAEAAQMDSVRSLLPRFEAKIQRVLDRVWGTATSD